MLVTLNVTTHPLVSGGAFLGLALLAVALGQRRLVLLALLAGVGMAAALPGVALADGSFRFAYAPGTWQWPTGAAEWLLAAGSVARIPAQLLAVALAVLVPAELVLAAAGRVSPRSALLAGLAARLQPLLLRDLRLVREELAARGLAVGRGAGFAERARCALLLWEAMLGGMLDRAFQTAAALETRGYGTARPTRGPLLDPALRSPVTRHVGAERAMVALALLLVVGAVAGRASGHLQPPTIRVFGGIDEPLGPLPLLLACGTLLLPLLPLAGRAASVRRDTAPHPRTARPAAAPSRSRTEGREPALDARDVSLTYPGAAAPSLDGASLQIAPGELVLVLGPSGSGKSTLLDVLSGVAPATTGGCRRGTIRIGAAQLLRCGDARGLVAAVFQHPEAQILAGQVAEEVAFGLRQTGLPLAEVEARTHQALADLRLLHLATRRCSTLSGGELQRVLLAAALALDPRLLVLDEPTSQSDAASEQAFWDAVDRARRERGIGVIAAEHRVSHVLHRCDRVLVLEEGHVAHQLQPSAIAAGGHPWHADPYAGLAPVRPAADGARLRVHIPRLEVSETTSGAARVLLRDLSMALPAGSVITLEGPNGSGKSTLLRALRGLHPAPQSVVSVDGVRRGQVGSSVPLLGYLSQQAGTMLPGRTVAEAAAQTVERLRMPASLAWRGLVDAALADVAERHPAELSVGQRQRLAIVAATAHAPVAWLFDEPTRGMDARSRRWTAARVLSHAAGGGVVLLATHDAQLAAAVASHRLRLDLRTGPSLMAVIRDASGRPVHDPLPRAPIGERVR